MKRLVLPGLVAAAALLVLTTIALAGSRPAGAPPVLPPTASPPASDRVAVPAPIDGVEVVIRESFPPQVAVRVSAGLPSGCAKPHSHSVERSGDTITVKVLNSMPAGEPICTMIYGMYELTIELGSDFEVGRTYTLRVNDHTTKFRT
jgi:hypothetical protein